MEEGNAIDIFLARHVSGTNATSHGTNRTAHTTYAAALKTIHPSKNSVQKTICCNSISNAPDDGRSTRNMSS